MENRIAESSAARARARRTVLMPLLIVLTCSCGAVTATNGQSFPVPSYQGESYAAAARASAARDMPCAPDGIKVLGAAPYFPDHVITVEGCGQRLTYNVACSGAFAPECQCILAARLVTRSEP